MIKGSVVKSEHAQKISAAMKRMHDRRRNLVMTYGEALAKIVRSKTAGTRARNIALKALNGKGA